jgi:hypothetical protein
LEGLGEVCRVAALVLIVCYAALGSGAVERWHNARHAADDARLVQAAQQAGVPLDHLPFHNDYNCSFHWQLHLSGMAVGWVPLLICLGLFLAFLTMLPVQLPAYQRLLVIPCRGPPVR